MLVHNLPPAFGCHYSPAIALSVPQGGVCLVPSFVPQNHAFDYCATRKNLMLFQSPDASTQPHRFRTKEADYGASLCSRSPPFHKTERYSPYKVPSHSKKHPVRKSTSHDSSCSPILSSLLSETRSESSDQQRINACEDAADKKEQKFYVNGRKINSAVGKVRSISSDHVSRVLQKTIKFAKHSPWSLKLSVGDQVRLFRNCWPELFLINLAEESSLLPDDHEVADIKQQKHFYSMSNASNAGSCDPCEKTTEAIEKASGISECGAEMEDFLQRCIKMRITQTEYEYLRCAVFFNSDLTVLEDKFLVGMLHHRAQTSLLERTDDKEDENVRQMKAPKLNARRQMRVVDIFLGLYTLRGMKSQSAAVSFLQPLLGSSDVEDILIEILLKDT